MVDSKKNTLQESLLQMSEGRTDEVALNLKARIISAGDIRAVDAKYHGRCYQTFKVSLKPGGTGKNPRNLDELTESRFCQLFLGA